MDLVELDQDRRALNTTQKLNNRIDAGFSKKAKSVVSTRAIIGGIAFAFPLFGLDNIIYCIVLWNMYITLAKMARPTGSNIVKSFIGGFLVNIIISSIIELGVSFIPIGGIIISFLVGYLSIKISGAAYLKVIEGMFSGKVQEKYDLNSVFK